MNSFHHCVNDSFLFLTQFPGFAQKWNYQSANGRLVIAETRACDSVARENGRLIIAQQFTAGGGALTDWLSVKRTAEWLIRSLNYSAVRFTDFVSVPFLSQR